MKNRFLLLFFFSLIFTCSFAQYDPSRINKKAIDSYNKAIQLAEGNNFDASIKLLKESIQQDPAYIEAYSIGDSINSLKKEIDLRDKSKEEIYRMIQKRFDVNDIHSVGKDDIKIQKTPDAVSVTVDYESRIPLFSNVALALSFHKSAVVR